MRDGDPPAIQSEAGERVGISDRDAVVANRWIKNLVGKQLVQFRMGYAIHLEFGHDHEVTIGGPFEVSHGEVHWGGEAMTAEAAGALLALRLCEVTSARALADGTLVIDLASAIVTIPPEPMYEAWELRGPDGLLIVCSPGGEYLAVWEPEA